VSSPGPPGGGEAKRRTRSAQRQHPQPSAEQKAHGEPVVHEGEFSVSGRPAARFMLTLELREDQLAGALEPVGPHGRSIAFHGWVDFLTAIDQLRMPESSHRRVEEPGPPSTT